MHEGGDKPTFQESVLTQLDAGYNLALWMLHDEHLASDAIQDAAFKAWRGFDSFQGGDGKSWFLAIVRTSVVDLVRRIRRGRPSVFGNSDAPVPQESKDDPPLTSLLRREHASLVGEVVSTLPEAVREILVLREMDGLSYAQISQVLDIPIGTVMSRVSRARDAAAAAIRDKLMKERTDGV